MELHLHVQTVVISPIQVSKFNDFSKKAVESHNKSRHVKWFCVESISDLLISSKYSCNLNVFCCKFYIFKNL